MRRRPSVLMSAFGLGNMGRGADVGHTNDGVEIIFRGYGVVLALAAAIGGYAVYNTLNKLSAFDHASIEQQFQSISRGDITLRCNNFANEFPETLEDYRANIKDCRRYLTGGSSGRSHTMGDD